MYEGYGLGQPSAWSVRTRDMLLYGTAQERRGRVPAQRPLSADIAALAMEQTLAADLALDAVPEMQLPVGAAKGIGELVAARAAEAAYAGQEG